MQPIKWSKHCFRNWDESIDELDKVSALLACIAVGEARVNEHSVPYAMEGVARGPLIQVGRKGLLEAVG